MKINPAKGDGAKKPTRTRSMYPAPPKKRTTILPSGWEAAISKEEKRKTVVASKKAAQSRAMGAKRGK